MATAIDFSIIVLTCNQREHTLRMVEAIMPYLQTNDSVEIVMVDNGSTDGTATALAPFQETLGERFNLIINRENRGVAAGRNIGLRAARGNVLMLLDNDTIPTSQALEVLRRYVSAKRSCGIAAPALFSPDGERQASAKPFPGIGIKISHVMNPGHETAAERRELASAHPFYVIGACQVFRRDVLNAVGFLDEHIFYGPEDADFCIRVRKAGYTVDYLQDVSIIHDWRRATRRRPLSRLSRLHFTALLYFYAKHHRLF